ncbi:helix-turn-helix domain-containing protein [Limosilactobacillus sp.]|uniref:helix-turn-helix domain-containing protein n=1 Tax=Limosilactobacillus sp. TaxID=2773925 RepID=UPI003F0E6620
MNTYWLRLCSYQQPRRVRVIENLLTNRRTVANLFWAQQYGLLQWLGARRTAQQDQLDAELQTLQRAGLLLVDDQGQVKLTATGVSYQEQHPDQYQPHFYDWYWLANTRRVQYRFLLACQVVSELAYHNHRYVPLTIPLIDQEAVRGWFHHYYSPAFVQQIYAELHLLIGSLESEEGILAPALVNLLIGHGQSGWTLDQLSQHLKLAISDTLVLEHDLFLAVSAFSKQTTGPIAHLIKPLLATSPLSSSSQETLQMFNHGVDLVTIADRRRLRLSTVREHLLTAAILLPQGLDWSRLLPKASRQFLEQHYTGEVTAWRFHPWATDSNQDFFYFRLYQIIQGRRHDG